MKLSLLLEARNGWRREIDSSRRSLGGLIRETRSTARTVDGMDRSITRSERSMRSLERGAYRMGYAVGSGTRRAIGGLVALERRLTLTNAQMGKLAYWGGSKIGGGLRTGLAWGTTAIGAAAAAAGYKVVSAGLQFEKYRTQLRGLEGSVAAGNKAMQWVTDFARTTPYELDQVMEAYVALKAYGIDPANGSLRTLGDTAAGMGKDLMQAVEMIADAQTGEFERLKEFGIRASVAGQKVTFSFLQNGKTMTRAVKKDAVEIQSALMTIFNQRFGGGMDRLAQTTAGKWSNMMDRITIMGKRVWEGGIGDAVNRQLDRIGASIDKMEADGSLKKWAEESGKAIGDLIDAIGRVDFIKVAHDIGEAASALKDFAEAGNWAGNALSSADAWVRRQGIIAGMGLRLPWDTPGRDTQRMQELRETNRKLGYGDWEGIDPAIGAAFEKQEKDQAAKAAASRDWQRRSEAERNSPAGKAFREGRFTPVQPGQPGSLLLQQGTPAKPAPPQKPPEGKVTVQLVPPPGWTAQPQGMRASGMQLQLVTGRAMGGPA